jgi:hypothetical protein
MNILIVGALCERGRSLQTCVDGLADGTFDGLAVCFFNLGSFIFFIVVGLDDGTAEGLIEGLSEGK